MWLIISGFFVHIVFLMSIFDIYFKSPIVHGISPHSSPLRAPAKRLVLFVADGLRADTFYEKADISPYLRSIITERGTWGVSHTRVPTETRPGHVALIAGLYEDPSAIARGWKENPVEFDSVFNQSRQTWSWGSPDILPMFSRGASGDHVWMEMYSSDLEDFSGKATTSHLDVWVFDRVKDFLNKAKSNKTLEAKLHEDKIVFFLHLLGLDTAGHTHKPYSKEYEENIRVVDTGVKEMEQLFENFYQHDNQTAYVFTSDHGMTNWGSHGAGDASETETPLVAWGAGVSGPKPTPEGTFHSLPSWHLDGLVRRDVRQADIAPLMATLIGIPVPVNSVMILSEELVHLSLAGLEYYETYYQCLLLTCITLAFMGWIAWLLWTLLGLPSTRGHYTDPLYGCLFVNILFFCLAVTTVYLIWVQSLPPQFYIYCLLPELLWWGIARQYKALFICLRRIKASIGLRLPLVLSVLYLLGVEILVLSFFYRPALSIGVLGIALWPLLFKQKHNIPKHLLISWLGSCILIAIFPALPVVGKDADNDLVKLTGFLWLLFATICTMCCNVHQIESRILYITVFQIVLILLVIWDIHSTAISLKLKEGLPFFNQVLSWTLFGLSMCLPLLGSDRLMLRLLNVILSLAVPFLLLSASHEGLFLLALSVHMVCWLALELHQSSISGVLPEVTFQCHEKKRKNDHQSPSSSDFRRAYFFLLYIILSFFGTGNIASINSFDPTWVRCFVTVFSPFLMTVLILWKTMVPFLAVTCTLRALNILVQASTEKLFLIVLVFCDIMGLHFLHLVKNEGSWLDIGTSISHYVILQTITLFLVLLYGVAKLLTGATLWPFLEFILHIQPSQVPSKLSLETCGREEVVYPDSLLTRSSYSSQNTLFKKRH
ncbi:GPI ethanolamine phosphate transferase 1 isoform X1 [Anabrus simplex]|uniref:GPI ethanolamine phosphate transferase 1 isoform X1 n=1 Tax=Anabrus simplex TaxID=316456 RepID=UPI0035A2A55D